MSKLWNIRVRIHSEPGNGLCLEDSAFAVVLVLGFRGVVGAGEGLQSLCIALRISSCVSDTAKNVIPPSFINQEVYVFVARSLNEKWNRFWMNTALRV